MQKFYTMPVTLTGSDIDQKRKEVRHYFHKTYDLFEALFECLTSNEVYYLKSEPTRHPMIFYFGHTAAFYVNKLVLGGVLEKRINPNFESMFAIGVDEMSWDDMDEKHYSWPSVDEVRAYREVVRKLMDRLIDELPLTLPIKQEDPFWIVLMGIEHERIHIETSSVLHRQLPISCIQPHESFPICTYDHAAPENVMIRHRGKRLSLGKTLSHHLYGWDNEYGNAEYDIEAFKVSKYLVSNAEFMPFVKEGGYENPRYWDEEGWHFVQEKEAKHPVFWVLSEDGSFKYRTMCSEISMPLSWPVDVNALEAAAFLRWKGSIENKCYRLLSEAEWAVLYETANIKDVPELDDEKANINLRHFASSCPVDRFKCGELYDILGNVWQWTSTPINGFKGFKPHPVYDDFSTPTFDGKHNLIKGGSWISTGNEIMKHSRYAFRRHFYQHAGFRYVESIQLQKGSEVGTESDLFERDDDIARACETHYGKPLLNDKNIATRIAEIIKNASVNVHKGTLALFGCSVGRSCFELAETFEKVYGLDRTARLIQVCDRLKRDGIVHAYVKTEGELTERREYTLKPECIEKSQNVEFWQVDPCNLKPHFQGYDVIAGINVLEKVYNPRAFLEELKKRINKGGVVILLSTYEFDSAITKKELWLGGYEIEGKQVESFETVKRALQNDFSLQRSDELEWAERISSRVQKCYKGHLSVWRYLG